MKNAMRPARMLAANVQSNTQTLRRHLTEMEEADLVTPLPGQAGQHVLWLATHVLVVEDAAVHNWILRSPPIMPEACRRMAGPWSIPQADPLCYPRRKELLDWLGLVRANTLAALADVPTEDWDRATEHAPAFLSTIGSVFYRLPMHADYHTGQIAAVRRMIAG